MVTHGEVLAYGQKIKSARPNIPRDDLRALLEAKFLHNADVFGSGVVHGAIANPLDWLKGLGLIAVGLAKLFGKTSDMGGVKDIIEGVVVILTPDPGDP